MSKRKNFSDFKKEITKASKQKQKKKIHLRSKKQKKSNKPQKKREMHNCSAVVNRDILQPLLAFRQRTKSLGSLGPCLFTSVDEFFAHTTENLRPPAWDFPQVENVISIGDVHGDLLSMLTLLRVLEVIDDGCNWIANQKLLIFTGDLLDSAGRGCITTSNNSREEVDIIQYLHFLRIQARMQKGDVVTIVGNHDLWRVCHNFDTYKNFLSPEQLIGWVGTPDPKIAQVFFTTKLRTYFAKYCPVFARVKNYVFMHGGVNQEFLDNYLRESDAVRAGFPGILNEVLFRVLSRKESCSAPFYKNFVYALTTSRDFMNPKPDDMHPGQKDKHQKNNPKTNQNEDPDIVCQSKIDQVMRIFRIKGGFVLGHTMRSQIEPYCAKKVFHLDYGLSRAFCQPPATRKMIGLTLYQPKNGSAVTIKYHECQAEQGKFSRFIREIKILPILVRP